MAGKQVSSDAQLVGSGRLEAGSKAECLNPRGECKDQWAPCAWWHPRYSLVIPVRGDLIDPYHPQILRR